MTNASGQKIILFDIDRTLLDTDTFLSRLISTISSITHREYGDIKERINEYIQELDLIYYFDFLDLLEKLNVSAAEYQSIINEYSTNSYIFPKYPDVIPALHQASQKNYSIGIFSEGSPRYQQNKLKNLQIDVFIDKNLVFIGQSKRTDEFLSNIPEGSIIVDDNIDVIAMLNKHGKHTPIFLNRAGKNVGKTVPKDVAVIRSLEELQSVL